MRFEQYSDQMIEIERFSMLAILRKGTHCFVDIFFDGLANTLLFAFAGAVAGFLYPEDLKSFVSVAVTLAIVGAGARLAFSPSEQNLFRTGLFMSRLFIAVAVMSLLTPRNTDKEITALRELQRVEASQQTLR